MKDYDEDREGFAGQILQHINAQSATHMDVTSLMMTVLPAKVWKKTKELSGWLDSAPTKKHCGVRN